jgi:hypothetical protein
MKTWWGGDVPFATNVSPRWGFLTSHCAICYKCVTPMGFFDVALCHLLQMCHPDGVQVGFPIDGCYKCVTPAGFLMILTVMNVWKNDDVIICAIYKSVV